MIFLRDQNLSDNLKPWSADRKAVAAGSEGGLCHWRFYNRVALASASGSPTALEILREACGPEDLDLFRA